MCEGGARAALAVAMRVCAGAAAAQMAVFAAQTIGAAAQTAAGGSGPSDLGSPATPEERRRPCRSAALAPSAIWTTRRRSRWWKPTPRA